MNPVTATPPKPPVTPAAAPVRQRFRFDNRFLAPILITVILVVGQLWFGILEILLSPLLSRLTFGLVNTYYPTFVAIVTAIVAEMVMGRFMFGKWPHLASAYVTGISVGILVRSPEVWPYILCSLISIVSKYALRVGGRHLWNPSNLGISVLLLLAPASLSVLSVQWGNEIWPMIIIWTLGTLILYKVGRLHISVTYVVSFFVLAYVRALKTGDSFLAEAGPITGPMYQLFICFMITDPKTTTLRKWSQCLVVVLVAIVEAILRLNDVVYAPFYALFIVGPIANVIEIAWDARKKARVAPALAKA